MDGRENKTFHFDEQILVLCVVLSLFGWHDVENKKGCRAVSCRAVPCSYTLTQLKIEVMVFLLSLD